MIVYETWQYKSFTFDIRTENDAEIEDIRQAMIRQGASLVMHRVVR